MRWWLVLILIGLCSLGLVAQDPEPVSGYVFLDSVVVLANRDGFHRDDFIHWMEDDTTLYEAFHNLRTMSYSFQTEWQGSYLNGKHAAKYQAECRQNYEPPCRSMEVIHQAHQGPVYRKNGEMRFYTLSLLQELFFTWVPVCGYNSVTPAGQPSGSGRVNQLKEIIFNPGSGRGIPVIGKKFELFGEKLSPWYRYAWYQSSHHGEPCYVFAIRLSTDAPPGKAIVQSMITYFRKEDRQVIYRSYHLKQQGLVIFDTKIQVSVHKDMTGKNYPSEIQYDGFWNLPGKRGEKGTFQIKFIPGQ